MRILCEGAFQIDPGVGKTLDPGVKRRDDGVEGGVPGAGRDDGRRGRRDDGGKDG